MPNVPPPTVETIVDVLVVGGGPAGLAAGVWLGRYRRSVLILDSGDHRNASTQHIHGYLGLEGLSPADFGKLADEQLSEYATVHRSDRRCVSVTGSLGQFVATLDDGSLVHAARVILATGVADDLPALRNFSDYYGRSVFHCPACDGYEAQGLDVVALGWDERLAGFAGTMLTWARSVTVVTGGFAFTGDDAVRTAMAAHGIELVEQAAVEFVGSPTELRGVQLADGRELPAQMVFFSYGHQPRTDLARALGCALDDEGYIVIDRDGCTTVDGVYAAGDVTAGYQVVQRAASTGTVAALSAALSLTGQRGAPSAPAPPPDVMAVAEELRN